MESQNIRIRLRAFDHRVLDGAPISMFLAELRDRIENPAILILSD